MKQLSLLAAASSLILILPGVAQAADMFTLEEHAPNFGQSILVSPLITASAPSTLTAVLSQSNVGPGSFGNTPGFEFADNTNNTQVSFGTNLNNVVITDANDGSALDTLTLTFSRSLSGVTFNFATIPLTPGSLIPLFATTDNALVFTSGTGVFNPASTDNEGSLTLSGGNFMVLNVFFGGSARVGEVFAVDNFLVTPAATVPEPGVAALLVGMGLPLVWKLRRRQQSARKTV